MTETKSAEAKKPEVVLHDHGFFMLVGLLMAVFATDWRWSAIGAPIAIAGLIVGLIHELKTGGISGK